MKSKIANNLIGWGIAIIVLVLIIGLVRSCSGGKDQGGDDTTQTKEKYIQWNCRGIDGVVLETLYPGDKIEIWHERHPLKKDNRCSYAAPDREGGEPYTAEISGSKADYNQQGVKDSLLFPDLDPESVVIVVGEPQDPIHKWRERRQFSSPGQKMVFKGGDKKTFVIVAVLNHPKNFYNGQIGMGGYTVTLGVNRKS